MPPLPIISNVYRITMLYTAVSGITPRNVWHLRSPSADRGVIADAIVTAAEGEPLMQGMDPDHHPDSFEILPLDGVSAASVHDMPSTAWTSEAASGAGVPAAAAVVSLRTLFRGPRGRGRLYIGPMQEPNIDDGIVLEDTRDSLEAAWRNFNTGLLGFDPIIALGVASYTHDAFAVVNSIAVSPICGTMRRRQDQLR